VARALRIKRCFDTAFYWIDDQQLAAQIAGYVYGARVA
jgi:hypothetical protein